MPCMDIFEQQSEEYKEAVLPKSCRKRVAVEALSDFGWGRYVGLDGAYVTMHSFGASAPADKLFKKFGITTEMLLRQSDHCNFKAESEQAVKESSVWMEFFYSLL